MDEFNSGAVKETLEKVVEVLEENKIEYRFLGSVVVAAINGRLHRKLGDLDLIIDEAKKDILFKKLTDLGYLQVGGMFAFARKYLALETLEHPNLMGVGYFYGKWLGGGRFRMGNDRTNVIIDSIAVKKVRRELFGIKFLGIPDETVASGIWSSRTNPKRLKEIELLKQKGIKRLEQRYIHITINRVSCDWLYSLVELTLNLIGAIRVRIGLSFDPWR